MNTSAVQHHKVLHYVRCGDTKQAFRTGQSAQEPTGELDSGRNIRDPWVVSFVIVPQAAPSFHPTPSWPVPSLDQMAFCAKTAVKRNPCFANLATAIKGPPVGLFKMLFFFPFNQMLYSLSVNV